MRAASLDILVILKHVSLNIVSHQLDNIFFVGIFMPGFSHPNNFFVRPPRSKLKKFESNTNESHSGTVKRSRSQAPINFELENNSNNSTRGVKRPARRDSLSKAKSLANNLHSISDVTTNRAVPKTRTPSNARGQESEMTIKVEEEDINRVITPINLSPHQLWLADDVIDARASSCTFNQQPIVCCKRKLGEMMILSYVLHVCKHNEGILYSSQKRN